MDRRPPLSVQQQQSYSYERQRRMQMLQREKNKKTQEETLYQKVYSSYMHACYCSVCDTACCPTCGTWY